MQRFFGFLFATIAGLLTFAGCSGGGGNPAGGGGGGGGSSATEPPAIVTTQSYPSNSATAAGGGTAWDITQVKTTLYGQFHNASGNAYDTLRVDVTFAQTIANALPSPGQPLTLANQLGVQIGINTGQSGYFQDCSAGAGSIDEFRSDAGDDPSRLADGNYSILASGGPIYTGPSSPGSEAQTTASGNVLTQVFYLETLGVETGSAPPDVKIDVAAFNGTNSGLTDCVPSNGTQIATN